LQAERVLDHFLFAVMSSATKLAVTIEGDEDRYLKIASAPLWLGGKWVAGNVYDEFYADPGAE